MHDIQQMEGVKGDQDILNFIKKNTSNTRKHSQQTLYENNTFMVSSLKKIISKDFDRIIEFERNKDVRTLVQALYKGNPVPQCNGVSESQLAQYVYIFKIVSACWKDEECGLDVIQELEKLIQIETNRHFFYISCRHFGSMSNLELSSNAYDTEAFMFQMIIKKVRHSRLIYLSPLIFLQAAQKKDIYTIRKLMTLMFCHKTQAEEIKLELSSGPTAVSNGPKPNSTKLLYLRLTDLDLWKNNDYWESAIFESIHEELKLASGQRGENQQEVLTRQKNLILSQMASYCHNMIMLGVPTKTVRIVVGRYCRYYDLPEEQNKDLSRTINNTFKQYREMTGNKASLTQPPSPKASFAS